jgi:hypothetical protein
VDPLLGNDRETNVYKTTVIRERPVYSNRGKVFSVPSAHRCYTQDMLGRNAGVVFCELLLEANS